MATAQETQLEEARSALHRLMTGTAVVEVLHGDQKIRYTETNRVDLENYIQKLENQIGTRRAPMGVIFR